MTAKKKNAKSATPAALKKVLSDCLQQAGEIIRRGFGTRFAIHSKGPVNIVTDVDMAAEKKIVSTIHKSFPDHQILAEESDPTTTSSPYRWIIDPIDGTTNFAHRIPLCCVSIGVEQQGRMVLGGIFNPLMRELYFAEAGKGATLNGRRIRVTKTSRLIDSLLVTGFPYDRQEKAEYYLKFFRAMMEKSQGIRRLGAAALDLAYVADGRFEAFWELNLKPWDIAAGSLIVREAGGEVTDYHGRPMDVHRPFQLLASNGRIHRDILSVFKTLSNAS